MTERQKEIERLGARLDPALKGWIDRVIVPGLVRQYLMQKSCTLNFTGVTHSSAHKTSGEVS